MSIEREQGAGSEEQNWQGKVMGDETEFRFQQLVIWQRAADLAIKLDEVSMELDERKKYRFAEQLRAAGLSISNNIAEGSGLRKGVRHQ